MTSAPDRLTQKSTGQASWAQRFAASASWLDVIAFTLTIIAALTIAGFMFFDYYDAPDLLWRNLHHDRNSHFNYGLDLALAVKQNDAVAFLGGLEQAKVWPPFHGLVLSAVLLLGGIDYRLAIVPSLIGWVVTIAFVWLIARWLFLDRSHGLVAATIAALLTALSPAFRLISADVMLEAIGAALSAAALWAYLRAFNVPQDRGRWRLLALILTALFFHKGNYWGLMVAALALAFASEHGRRTLDLIRIGIAAIDIRAAARRVVRDPLLILFVLLVTLVAYLYWRGPSAITLFGRSVSLYPPGNLTTAAYAMLFIWTVGVWRRHRSAIEDALGCGGRALLYWHLTPIAISFLLPRRLSRFLWFVGPSNNPNSSFDLPQAIGHYWRAFANGFHPAPWLAVVVVLLSLFGATRVRTLRPGARVVFIFAALAFAGVVFHPQHQDRFVTTWVFAVWICAGVGAGILFGWMLGGSSALIRATAATMAVLLLAATGAWYRTPAAAYVSALHPVSGPSDVDLVRPYLAELDGAREVAFVTTFGYSSLFSWVLSERCGCHVKIDELRLDNPRSREDAKIWAAERLLRTRAKILVSIDSSEARYAVRELGWVYPNLVGMLDALAEQTRYVPGKIYDLPGHNARATIWHLRDGQ